MNVHKQAAELSLVNMHLNTHTNKYY